MQNPNILPVHDEQGNQINDSGKSVLINSTSGCLVNYEGTVTAGPFKYRQEVKYKEKDKNGKPKLMTRHVITEPYWEVEVTAFGRTISFARKELTFK